MNDTILVVENDRTIARTIRNMVRRLGYNVVRSEFSTGEAAIEAAASQNPALILMNVGLTGKMNGREAGDIIWSDLQIPIIYITGYLVPGSDLKTLDLLSKPIDKDTLKAAIENCLT
ncbi:response regulator [Candidatus Poribacteria bacterium]|nr:response regulator [Candidatus Poribacteria bacterium]